MRVCRSFGSEIAHWLFWQKNTTGAFCTAAKTNASLTSPCDGRAVAEVGDDRGVAAGLAVPTAWSRWMPIA